MHLSLSELSGSLIEYRINRKQVLCQIFGIILWLKNKDKLNMARA